jgi:hypothetical protein
LRVFTGSQKSLFTRLQIFDIDIENHEMKRAHFHQSRTSDQTASLFDSFAPLFFQIKKSGKQKINFLKKPPFQNNVIELRKSFLKAFPFGEGGSEADG